MAAVRVIVALFATGLLAACSDSPSGPTYTVGGTVAGLSSTGLVLQNNGGNSLTVAASGGNFTFSAGIASGGAYDVTVLTQPAYQNCTVGNGTGTMASTNVTNVAVTCTTPTVTIGGTVTGLIGGGLVIRNNGGNNLAIATSGNFTFTTAIASGTPYNVTVFTDPAVQTCTVTNGAGTAAKVNITSVTVTCPVVYAQHEVVTANATTGAVGALGTISAICPGTKRVLGGGYRSGSGSEVWRVWTSRPVDAGGTQAGDRGWAISFTSVVAGQAVTVHVVCANPDPNIGYEVATASLLTGTAGTAGVLPVVCPGVKRVMAGGYSSANSLEAWRLVRSRMVGDDGVTTGIRGWSVDFTSVVAGQTVNAHAVCSHTTGNLGHQVVTVNVTTGTAGTLGTVSAICPVDKNVLSGGFTSVGASEVWRVWRNYPVEAGVQVGDRGWAVDFTSVVAGQTVSAFAICGFAPT